MLSLTLSLISPHCNRAPVVREKRPSYLMEESGGLAALAFMVVTLSCCLLGMGARTVSAVICFTFIVWRAFSFAGDDESIGAHLMLRAPSPVSIALPKQMRLPSWRYSRHHCVGNMEAVDDLQHRACVFHDVCYDLHSSDFVYYMPPGNVTPPVLYDHRHGELRRFRQRVAPTGGDHLEADFVALSKFVKYRQRMSWSPRTHTGALPTRRVAQLSGLHALSAPFVPTNLGHVAWDEGFPLLAAMTQLGIYTPYLHILRTHGCDELDDPSSQRVCAKFEAAFIEPLLGSRQASLLTLAQLSLAHRDSSRYVCFERLLVGGTFDSFNSDDLNDGKEPLIALYRARVLAWHGVPFSIAPRRHRILLVQKDGRRGIHNFRAVRRHISARFGRVAEVRVTSFSGLPMAEQLSLVAGTTVAISPCGGISMILPFLPQGAHAILMNYMLGPHEPRRHGECDGCSWSMEAELWRHVRHVHKQYYQVWGPRDFAKGQPGRDAAVRVDVARLENLVAAALMDMQP